MSNGAKIGIIAEMPIAMSISWAIFMTFQGSIIMKKPEFIMMSSSLLMQFLFSSSHILWISTLSLRPLITPEVSELQGQARLFGAAEPSMEPSPLNYSSNKPEKCWPSLPLARPWLSGNWDRREIKQTAIFHPMAVWNQRPGLRSKTSGHLALTPDRMQFSKVCPAPVSAVARC